MLREICQAVLGFSLTESDSFLFKCGSNINYMFITHRTAVIKHGLLDKSTLLKNMVESNMPCSIRRGETTIDYPFLATVG